MTRHALSSAVITTPGTYEYAHITPAEARAWWSAGPVASTIGYAETAAARALLLGTSVRVDRRIIEMQTGDEALVFRLRLAPGTARLDARDKGRLGEILADQAQWELGLLRRIA